MAYQNIIYEREKNLIHLWDDKRGYMKFPYQKYGYILDPDGEFTAMDGNKVTKVFDWDESDEQQKLIYESDLSPETRTLIDMYYESDDVSEDHKELMIDIEVEASKGFPIRELAEQEITAIAYYYKPLDYYCVLILDKKGKVKRRKIKNVDILPFATEKELLTEFINHYSKLGVSIITGWNSNWFDLTYMYNRMKQVIGERLANKLSPINIVKWSTMNNCYRIYGVSCLDYLDLYKKFTQNERSLYTLDAIATEELGYGKIKYDGTLDQLFEEDIDKFIEYNLTDVKLIYDLDKKLDFIQLARGIAHKGHVPYEEVYMSSRFIDGAAVVFMKRNGNVIVPNRKKWEKIKLERAHKIGETEILCENYIQTEISKSGCLRIFKTKSSSYDLEYIDFVDNYFILKRPLEVNILKNWEIKFHFEGAFVKDPIPGLYDWLYDLDLASMYPSNIMTMNISPETKIGKILEYVRDTFQKNNDHIFKVFIAGEMYEMTSAELKQYIKENKYSLASNGVMYRTDKKGLIPSILESWFDERTNFKNLMKQFGKAGDTDKYKFFNSRQTVLKNMLNSFYGVLGLASFRFYDLDNADATTSIGRDLIQFSSKMANYYYNNEIGDKEDYIVYTDTDSVFVSAIPLVKFRYPEADIKDDILMSKYILEIANEVQTFINESYNYYAEKFHYVTSHRWKIKQELIAKTGLWITKKRYALWVINKETVPVDELEVKGIDVVRSNFPKEFRTFTKKILTDILKKVDKKEIDAQIFKMQADMDSFEALNIMFPTSVNNMTEYKNEIPFRFTNGAPAHVKAGLSYNDLLVHYGYEKYIAPIKDADKVRWTYLRQNPFRLDSVALKGNDDPPEIIALVEKYMDRQKNFNSVLKNKLDDFYTALNWGTIPQSDLIDNFFDI